MELTLDDEAIECLEEYGMYMGDDSYANHLAYKIYQLYTGQEL